MYEKDIRGRERWISTGIVEKVSNGRDVNELLENLSLSWQMTWSSRI